MGNRNIVDDLTALGATPAADDYIVIIDKSTGEVKTVTTANLVNLTFLALDADLATFALPGDTTISAFAKTLLDDADAAAILTTLGLTATVAEINTVCDGGVLKHKVIDIGDWDMDATVNIQVAHGLTRDNIRQISVVVRDDAAEDYYPLDYSDAAHANLEGAFYINQTQVQLFRRAGGIFDHTDFNSTSYNRGWITIWYVV